MHGVLSVFLYEICDGHLMLHEQDSQPKEFNKHLTHQYSESQDKRYHDKG